MPAFITIPFFIIPELAKFISFHIHLSSVKRGIPLFRAKHPQQSSTANLRREVKHLDGARARYSKNTRVMLKFVSFAHLCKSLFSLKFETDPYLLKSKKKKKKSTLRAVKIGQPTFCRSLFETQVPDHSNCNILVCRFYIRSKLSTTFKILLATMHFSFRK